MKKLFGIITIATLLAVLSGNALAGSKSAIMLATARVLPVAKHTILYQKSNFTVTEADIMKGFIDIPMAMVLSIRTNSVNGYLLLFSAKNGRFNELTVFDGDNAYKLSETGGEVHMPYENNNYITKELGFRFYLSPDFKPGIYQWPVAVMITAI